MPLLTQLYSFRDERFHELVFILRAGVHYCLEGTFQNVTKVYREKRMNED